MTEKYSENLNMSKAFFVVSYDFADSDDMALWILHEYL